MFSKREFDRFRLFAWLALTALVMVTIAFPNTVEFAQKRTEPSSQEKAQKPAGSQDTKRDLSWGADKPLDPTVPAYKADTQAYALIIGISAYGNLPQSAQLKFADADARELHDFLVGEKGGFRPENVTLLVNGDASHDQIMRELARLQNLSGPDSIALIFFAGHGLVNKSGQAFLVAADTKLDDLINTGIDMNLFNSTVRSMRSRSAIIISDACHSGALSDLLAQPGSNSLANLSVKAFAEPGRQQSSFIFSAASPTQSSIERGALRHGLFTYYMLQGLGGPADADGDGVVTSSELYSFVAARIREDKEIQGIKQVPEFNPSFDRSIPLAVVTEEGRTKYRRWFSEDPFVSRWVAAFDEALNENRLTRPEGNSAWDYYLALSNFGPASTTIALKKKDELLARIGSQADKVIEQLPADSNSWDETRQNLDKAYQLGHDDSFKARQLFATVMYFHTTGETARAERECDNTLALIEDTKANNPQLSHRIGQFYANLKKWDKAGRAYHLVIDKNPTIPWITEYAQVLMHLGNYTEAEEYLRRANNGNPDYQPALVSLAQALLHNPQNERVIEARRLVAHARAITPDDPDTEELWGRILLATGESKLAIDSLMQVVIGRSPGEKRDTSLLYLSDAFVTVGDLDRAISALREAESRGSKDVAIYDALAARLDEQGAVDKTVAMAQKAAELTKGQNEENSRRVRMMAEYLERSGQLQEAAYKFREASKLTTDGKLSTSLETHARVLLLRSDRASEAGPLASVRAGSDRSNAVRFTPLIIPGGLDALKYLTGVTIDEADPVVLARVFEACLRNPAINSRVQSFYEDYPELARKVALRGSSLSGSLDLPSPTQTGSSEAREALKFFGVSDKNGKREFKSEFQIRQHMLEALGGNAAKLQRGEPVRLKLQNDELPVLRGMDSWASLIRDGVKARPEQQLLAFLKDAQAMRLYVAFSVLPDEAIRQLSAQLITKDKLETLPASLSFATPYLRFTPEGDLEIPGQRQGELNWQRAMRLNNSLPLVRALFQRDSGGALYLFCALSASGDVGDYIARSPAFEQIFRFAEKSVLPTVREPFDLIDFFRLLHVENDQLHLSKAGELWLRSTGATDPVGAVLAKVAGSSPGREIPVVKQLSVLAQIERERPDWAADKSLLSLIADQTSTNRESGLELALDLRMSPQQLTTYYALVTKLDALQVSPAKTNAIRSFQSSFGLLREIARNSALPQSRLSAIVDRLLTLDPLSSDYGPQLVAFVRRDLLDADDVLAGAELENKLIKALTASKPVDLPSVASPASTQPDSYWQFDVAARQQEQIKRFLSQQKFTKFPAVADAFAALAKLKTNPGAADELAKLKSAVDGFVEPEREPEPKKKKSKQPVVVELTLKETVARLSNPVSAAALDEVRSRLVPAVGEALLGCVYSGFAMNEVSFNPDLVRKHDFVTAPWGDTKVENERISGSVARLSKTLSGLQAKGIGSSDGSAIVATMIASAQLVDRRQLSRRAEEYVARMMDLGEEMPALSYLGDQTATSVMNQINILMTARRATEVKSAVEHGEIAKALRMMSPSELYALGQSYLNQRLASVPAQKLADEPGALGAIARIVSRDQSALAGEIRQFGMPATTRTGLARLDLIEPEPYERSSGFTDDDRLAERFQDLKLASVRRSHRIGADPFLPLSSFVIQDVAQGLFAEVRKTTGSDPPARDWKSLVNILQRQDDLTPSITQISKSAFVRTSARNKWDQR